MSTATAQPRPKPPARGIHCPACGCGHFFVLYTRRGAGGKLIRRRECRNCGRRITTWEGLISTFASPHLREDQP